ncbi:MAG TPA: ABC transporter substrate-binding protein [Gaiellaceae bacterium]|nr:ABC transporter substrate-binding protein [Gaiellaceae bacterium]
MKKRLFVPVCLLALAVSAAAAWARPGSEAADPGVTSTKILIGGTTPLSGVAAAYASVARGAEAYFKYVNARGGVNGRKIEYRYYDDAYNPQQTIQQTRKLVQEDKVFAIYNSLGTEHNLATRKFLNTLRVPQVFVATGATTFSADYRRYPWSIGYQPSYVAEGRIYGRAIGQLGRNRKVAVFYQDDDYGKELLAGVRQGLRFAGRGGRIVSSAGYAVTDTDITSQIAKLKGSGANVLVIAATPAPAIRAYIAVNKLGWKPRIVVNAVASASNTMKISQASSGKVAEGSIAIVFLKDPTDPRWRNDKGGRLYRQVMSTYCKGCDASDVYNVYGMASAHTFVTALRKAGRNLTRQGLMRALTSLNERDNPFLLPGITVRTSARDRFPIKQARLQRWTKGRWVGYGPVVDARALG